MIDMETSKPLDKALNFNQENFFEYIDILLHNMNTEIIGSQSMRITKNFMNILDHCILVVYSAVPVLP